jgi:hypothetical protein
VEGWRKYILKNFMTCTPLPVDEVKANYMCDKCVENFVWKYEGKRQLGDQLCRWEDNTKMNLIGINEKDMG